MKKQIIAISLMLFVLLIVGCSGSDTKSTSPQYQGAVGGGCGVAPITDTPSQSNQVIKYVEIEASL